MKVERFALGLCFDASGGGVEPEALWGRVLSTLTVSDISGLAVYGGMADISGGEGEECRCYVCALTNGSLRQMRRVYRKLLADAGIGAGLYAPRPFIQANILAGIEGLTYFGKVARDGCIIGGDMPDYKLKI